MKCIVPYPWRLDRGDRYGGLEFEKVVAVSKMKVTCDLRV